MTGSSPSVSCATTSEHCVPVETHGNRTGRTDHNDSTDRNGRRER